MSNAIYPVLPGLTWNVLRKPLFNTKVQMASSGSSLAAGFYSAPLRSWTLNYDVLRQFGSFRELDTIAAFFNARNGKLDSFLFEDPDDKSVTAMGFGVGNGTTTAFQLQRVLLGTFARNAGAPNNATFISTPRTNFMPYSESVGNWSTSVGGTGIAPVRTDPFDVAPDGTFTAGRCILDVAAGTTGADWSMVHNWTAVPVNADVSIGDQACSSVWLRTNDGSTVTLNMLTVGCSINQPITVTPQWQRFTHTGPLTDAANIGVRIILGGTDPQKRVDLLVWGAQAEVGSTPTDYIKTPSNVAVQASPAYWPASADGFEPIYNLNYSLGVQIYVQDWEGNQLQYSRARTNLLLQSGDFNTTWTKTNTTVTVNNTTAPDGTATADKLLETAVTNFHYVWQPITPSRSTRYTMSVWVKPDVRTKFAVGVLSGTNANYVGATIPQVIFDLTTPSAPTITNNASGTGTLTRYPNGWWRATVTFVTTAGTPTADQFGVMLYSGAANSYLGVATSGLWLWGAQLEAEPQATSYIPTTTIAASVTDYTLSTSGLVTFSTAPLANAVLTWSGSYYWRVRFKQDMQESDNFMYKLYSMKKVELEMDR